MGRSAFVRYGWSVALGLISLSGLVACSANPGAAPAAGHAQQAAFGSDTIDAAETMELTGLQKSFEAVAHHVAGTVVAISASTSHVESDAAIRYEELNGEKLQAILEKTTRTVGTGFIIDPNGYVLTNQHVIEDAQQLWITTDTHKVYPAIVIGSDPRADLAVLKVPAQNLPAAHFAPAGTAKRGDWTIALGNPYGLATDGEMAMSVGVISAINRSLPKLASKEDRMYCNLLQTTAQINPGNSGGPLFDLDGQVIGITTAVILPQKQTNGIGFAMPVTPKLLSLIDDLKQGHEVVYGYLGVSVSTPTAKDRRFAGINQDIGVRVDSVESNCPNAASVLKERDMVTQIDGQPIEDAESFVRLVGCAPVGKLVQLDLYRDGRPMTLQVTPSKRKLPQPAITSATQRFRWHGMVLGPIPANWATTQKCAQKGLMVVAIDSSSPLTKQGIAQGSIITAIGGQPVASIIELQRLLNDKPVEKCDVQLANSPGTVVSVQGDAALIGDR